MAQATRSALACGWTLVALAGCGPAPPKVLLDLPKDMSPSWHDCQLFHTPRAYIYAQNETAAGEADRWVEEVERYVHRKYKRELGKGLVIVLEPQEKPLAETLEELVVLERDPAVLRTPPSRPKTMKERRERLKEHGIPERAVVRGSAVALSPSRLREMGIKAEDAAWAVAAPSHALAVECGTDVGASAFRKRQPRLTEDQARKLAGMTANQLAKAFEITRGDVVFLAWAQKQNDWSDDRRRETIRERLRYTCRSNWLPTPSDDDLEW